MDLFGGGFGGVFGGSRSFEFIDIDGTVNNMGTLRFLNVFVNDFSIGNLCSSSSKFNPYSKDLGRGPLILFLTKCDGLMEPIVQSDFLLNLRRTLNCQLYMPELIFGYLKYVASTKYLRCWNNNLPCTIFDELLSWKKIILIRPRIPSEIRGFAGEDTTLRIRLFPQGSICQILEFEYQSGERRSSKFYEVGTIIARDMEGVKLSNVSQDISSRAISDSSLGFDKLIPRISRNFELEIERGEEFHYELDLSCQDKLTDAWYIKQLYDYTKRKVHVTVEYQKFIQLYLPEFSDAVSCHNIDGRCRFHYDCCQLTSNDDCVPGKEWASEFEVEMLNI